MENSNDRGDDALGEKLADHLAYQPRALRADRAAAYLSLSTSAFLRLVDDGVMPQPVRIHGIVAWDRLDLDAAFDDLKDRRENTMQALLRKRQEARK